MINVLERVIRYYDICVALSLFKVAIVDVRYFVEFYTLHYPHYLDHQSNIYDTVKSTNLAKNDAP